MKNDKNRLKLFLILFTSLILISSLLLFATLSFPQVDKLTINAYIENCQQMLFLEINKEEIRDLYELIKVSFNRNPIIIKTSFFNAFIINKDVMEEFLYALDWTNIIFNHNFSLVDTYKTILELYLEYIKNVRCTFNKYSCVKRHD